MTIDKKPRRYKTKYTRRVNNKRIKKWKNFYFKFLIYTFVLFLISSIFMWLILYNKYIVWLPSVEELENIQIAESSIIYDRNWEELYKIFKEKRTYVPFEIINKNMINAIVSIEDKRYWSNPWVDIIWLFRAWFNYILWISDSVKWTSTLTQQLISNTLISNERSVELKIKEIYLAYKLTSSLSKEKILELYLNKISYWSNAYGIEEASKTFFWKSSKDLWILEASMLASLPKWPTYYSPYNHADRLIGYPYVYLAEDEENIVKIISQKDKVLNQEMLNMFTDFINNLKFSKLEWTDKILICNLKKDYFKNNINIDNDWCSVITYSDLISFLNSIRIKWELQYIEYETWRKDRVLWRMLEDWYINFDEYKNSILNWIWYVFNKQKENIKAPHFVFYVKEYLEEKYWKDIISVWWLKIYTTLDLKLQEKAEEIVKIQAEKNKTNFNANNAALISIDNKNWEIITMVGWKDYFDTENKWNVNIITSTLQPWSSFKPFVYSIWIFEKQIWSKTPIYDLETDFPWWYTPKNFDWKFMWKMDISTALNNSRNIPAIKMLYMAWWEKNIVNFMKKLWVKSLKEDWRYWAPLALWTWEMTPLELATAYSVFANMWEKNEITPILKVIDSKWNIIEENWINKKTQKIISADQSYILNSILSDTSSRPSWWNKYLSLKNRVVAAKTWTSTKQYIENWKKQIYPSNLWTIWYTPQITTVVWAWNTDWTQLYYKWNWLEWAWTIWNEFMAFVHEWKEVEKWKQPEWVKKINISEISWLLPNPETSSTVPIIESLFINIPTEYDNSYKQIDIDSLCNWKITEKTPEAAIKKVTVLQINSIDPSNQNWQLPVIEWSKTDEFKEKYWNISNIVTDLKDKECERTWSVSNIVIRTTTDDNSILTAWENYIQLAYKSNNPIIKIDIIINNDIVDSIDINNKKEWSFAGNIFIPISKAWKDVNLKLRAVDNQYYSWEVTKIVTILRKDESAPEIELINPIDWSIKLYNTDYFNLKANIIENSSIRTVNILLNWNNIKTGIIDRIIVYPINSQRNISVWKHVITIEAIDSSWNKWTKDVQLEVLER